MDRPKLFWFGKLPSDDEQKLIREHELELVVHQPGSDPDFRFGRAAIFWATDTYFGPATSCLREYLTNALNDGLYVVPVVSGVPGDLRLTEVSKIIKEADRYEALSDQHRIRSIPLDLHNLLHQILLHDPGPARNVQLDVNGGMRVTPEHRLLLERSFHDCSSIRLKSIASGFSGANTFIVDATLKESFAGPEPMPFFVKLGRSNKLKDEMQRFRIYAEHHVPWYLRPNFVAERSRYGIPEGVLVGTFVQDSKSLRDCIRTDGARYIKTLFEETLGGLRRQTFDGASAEQKTVVDALGDYCKPDNVPADRWRNAAALFGGAAIDPRDLWCRLLGLPTQNWRKSAIHGDLHGENVRIRKSDAIVIDFAQAGPGPACADLAQMEVWAAFDVPISEFVFDEWKAIVTYLYSSLGVGASFEDSNTVVGATWIQRVVGEIRRFATNSVLCEGEYKRVLAVYLLRQASFPPDEQFKIEDEQRRAYAYWLACRLVEALEAEASAVLTTA